MGLWNDYCPVLCTSEASSLTMSNRPWSYMNRKWLGHLKWNIVAIVFKYSFPQIVLAQALPCILVQVCAFISLSNFLAMNSLLHTKVSQWENIYHKFSISLPYSKKSFTSKVAIPNYQFQIKSNYIANIDHITKKRSRNCSYAQEIQSERLNYSTAIIYIHDSRLKDVFNPRENLLCFVTDILCSKERERNHTNK